MIGEIRRSLFNFVGLEKTVTEKATGYVLSKRKRTVRCIVVSKMKVRERNFKVSSVGMDILGYLRRNLICIRHLNGE